MENEELKDYIYNVLKNHCQNEYDLKKAKSTSGMLSFQVYGMTIGEFLVKELLGYDFPVQRVITALNELLEERKISYNAYNDRYVCKDIRVL